MITEDYVSYETAKLLKEKGFDEYGMYFYTLKDEGCEGYKSNRKLRELAHNSAPDLKDRAVSCPTLQMAMKWLREVHNLFIKPEAGETNGKTWYDFDIIPINGRKIAWNHYNNLPLVECNSCEEACEVAIKYCLENLI